MQQQAVAGRPPPPGARAARGAGGAWPARCCCCAGGSAASLWRCCTAVCTAPRTSCLYRAWHPACPAHCLPCLQWQPSRGVRIAARGLVQKALRNAQPRQSETSRNNSLDPPSLLPPPPALPTCRGSAKGAPALGLRRRKWLRRPQRRKRAACRDMKDQRRELGAGCCIHGYSSIFPLAVRPARTALDSCVSRTSLATRLVLVAGGLQDRIQGPEDSPRVPW